VFLFFMSPEERELSLYFELREGEKADLEVISSAALAWVETLRAAVKELDAATNIRVEYISADEGSLRLNALLEWFAEQLENFEEGKSRKWRLYRLLLALVVFVPVGGYPTYDFYFGDHAQPLAEEDRKRLDELAELLRKSESVEAPKRKFYRTLERDPAITAVGIAPNRKEKPAFLIPSNQFAEMGGLWQLEDATETERVTRPVLDVVLIRPALVHTPRSWTFKPDGLPEFEAVMRDQRVLSAIRERGIQERLREGISMTIRLEVRERRSPDGTWHLVRGGRSVIEVISPRPE